MYDMEFVQFVAKMCRCTGCAGDHCLFNSGWIGKSGD